MMLRWALTVTYVGVLIVALVAEFYLKNPTISAVLFWGVLVWFVASFFVYRHPAMSRPVGLGRTPRPAGNGTGGAAPLPSTSPVDLGFCLHCGTHVAPGTSECPSCGRTVLPV